MKKWMGPFFSALIVLLVVAHIFIVRPYYMRWGATEQEVLRALPTDSDIPPSSVVSTRAITIHASSEVVWSWLVQLGQGRGGFYSYDWLENLFAAHMRNAQDIRAAWQDLKVGDQLSMQEDGPALLVTQIEAGRYISLTGWGFYLEPLDEHTTRLIVRYPYPVKTAFDSLFYYGMFEELHFVMELGMMMGIKYQAENGPWR